MVIRETKEMTNHVLMGDLSQADVQSLFITRIIRTPLNTHITSDRLCLRVQFKHWNRWPQQIVSQERGVLLHKEAGCIISYRNTQANAITRLQRSQRRNGRGREEVKYCSGTHSLTLRRPVYFFSSTIFFIVDLTGILKSVFVVLVAV